MIFGSNPNVSNYFLIKKELLNIKILSFDQSTSSTGYAILGITNNDIKLKEYGLIEQKSKDKDKLTKMMRQICELICTYAPDYVVIEDTFMSINATSLKELCKLQGAIIYQCSINNIPITIYSPTHWRKCVGFEKVKGLKRAELKEKSKELVFNKFNIQVQDDISDAICIGMAYAIENLL